MPLAVMSAAGVVFAAGLVLGGMTQPGKVIAFLDVTGRWDPSLACVMGGALATYAVGFRLVRRRSRPVFGPRFQVPSRGDLSPRLLIGAALFGVGWAVAGFCPGPAVVAAGAGRGEALLFLPSMMIGMWLFRRWDAWTMKRAERAA
jgi:uncharacterized membrane protein YedE/YeeE